MNSMIRFLLAVGVCLFAIQSGPSATGQDDDKIDFVKDVKPLLEKHCLRCHGPEEQEGSVRIDDRDSIIDVYVNPGEDASESYFYELLVSDGDDVMPPEGEGELTADEIATFRKWINQGADWPEGVEFAEPVGDESDGDEEGSNPDQNQEKEIWVKIWENVGVLHPALVHFPIALLVGGAFFAVFGFRGDSPMGDAAYYCLWLSAVSGIFACAVGWSYAEFWHKHGASWDDFDFTKTIVQHRWGGILVAVLNLILAIMATSSRRRDPYANGGLWKIGMVLLAAFCGYVGHLGGDLTHGGEVEDAMKNLGIIQEPGQEDESDEGEGANDDEGGGDDETVANESGDDDSGNDDTGNEETGNDDSGDDGNGDNESSDDTSDDDSNTEDLGDQTSGGDEAGDSTSGDGNSGDDGA